jgi:hypothetical protein
MIIIYVIYVVLILMGTVAPHVWKCLGGKGDPGKKCDMNLVWELGLHTKTFFIFPQQIHLFLRKYTETEFC